MAPVDVEVQVTPGPRTMLREVEVEGVAEGIDGDALFADLVGRPLNPAALDARARKLVEAHAEAGYLGADARVRLTVSADGLGGAATVVVITGPPVFLRSVLIKGYRRTRRALIERAVDLHSGDALAPSRIAAIRRRLYDIGVFSRVTVEAVGDEDRVKDLVIRVDEKPNLYVELGGGLATDEGARVFLRGGHRNLWGLAHRLTVLGQAGIGWVGDGWTFAWQEPEWRAALRYEAPGVPARGESMAIDLLINEQAQEPLFRLSRTGGGIALLLRLGAKGRAEIAYRVQQRRLLDVDPGLLVAGDPWLDELDVGDLGDPRPVAPSEPRQQSGIGVSVLYDLRDDPFNPTTGGVGSLSVDIADRVVGDVSFVRTEGAWTQYVPASGYRFLFRLRGGAATVPGGDASLPVEDRFRLGGGASLRGFALDSLGPTNEVSQEAIDLPEGLGPIIAYADRTAPSRWVPTGGDAMGVGTFEVQIPFSKLGLDGWEGTDLALFSDVGNVWYLSKLVHTDSADQGLDPLLRWSVGVGLRRSTAIGPVAVDVGFNPARIEFREESWARLHVSLGAL
jgi:outer membrane protein assembly factor BamA